MKNISLLKKEKKFDEIIDFYEDHPNEDYSLFELNLILESYYKTKNYKKGEMLSSKIIERYPDNKFTLKWKAYILFEIKDYENVRYILEKIISTELEPFGADIKKLYETYIKLKEKEKAKKLFNDYKKILSKNKYLSGWYYKENIKYNETSNNISIGEKSDYLSYLEIIKKIEKLPDNEKTEELEKITIIKKYSKNKYIANHLASLYVKKNQFEKAEKIYNNLEEESRGTDTFNRKSLGFLYIKWERYDEGIRILLDMIESYIREKPFQKMLAKGVARSKNKEKYIEEIRSQLDISQEVKKYYYPLMAEIKKQDREL